MINIFTGPVGSGKTTKLQGWIKKNSSACGILMPVIEGIRYVYSIREDKLTPIELSGNESGIDVLRIGKFRFSKRVFKEASETLIDSLKSNCGIIVVDEVGPLELNGNGFCSAVKKVIRSAEKDILLVVREGLVEDVIAFFKIKEYKVIRNIDSLKGEKSEKG